MPEPNSASQLILQYLELLIEALNVLAWPLLLWILICSFRQEIKPLFGKLTSVGPGGVTLGASQDTSHANEQKQDVAIREEPLADPVAKQIESSIQAQLQKFREEDRSAILLRSLTLRVQEKEFMKAYSEIFGSQIQALELLNQGSVSTVEAQRLFEELTQKFPALKSGGLQSFLNFLKVWKFIDVAPESISITQTGRSFLVFLAKEGLRRNRPF